MFGRSADAAPEWPVESEAGLSPGDISGSSFAHQASVMTSGIIRENPLCTAESELVALLPLQ